jgi:hypothetical protein
MYHTGKNPLRRTGATYEDVFIPKGKSQRRLHKAFLRWHDAGNWPLLRDTLKQMGRADLIGSGPDQLIPLWQPHGMGGRRLKPTGAKQSFSTQHTRPVSYPGRQRGGR